MLHSQVSPGEVSQGLGACRLPTEQGLLFSLLLQKQKKVRGVCAALYTSQMWCGTSESRGEKKKNSNFKIITFKNYCGCHLLKQGVVTQLICPFQVHAPLLRSKLHLLSLPQLPILSLTPPLGVVGGILRLVALVQNCPYREQIIFR